MPPNCLSRYFFGILACLSCREFISAVKHLPICSRVVSLPVTGGIRTEKAAELSRIELNKPVLV